MFFVGLNGNVFFVLGMVLLLLLLLFRLEIKFLLKLGGIEDGLV